MDPMDDDMKEETSGEDEEDTTVEGTDIEDDAM